MTHSNRKNRMRKGREAFVTLENLDVVCLPHGMASVLRVRNPQDTKQQTAFIGERGYVTYCTGASVDILRRGSYYVETLDGTILYNPIEDEVDQ